MTLQARLRQKRSLGEPLLRELEGQWPGDIILRIKGNESVHYHAYPFFFHPAFPGVPEELVSRFAVGCRILLESVILGDKIVDGEWSDDYGRLYLRVTAMQIEATHIFHELFPTDSVFWKRFREASADYARNCVLEQELRAAKGDRSLVTREMSIRVAAGKFPHTVLVAEGMAELAGDRGSVEALTRSIAHYDMATCYWDDLQDWRKDLRNGTPSMVLGELFSAHPELRETDDPSAFARALYCDGRAEVLLDAGIGHLSAGVECVAHLPLADWTEFLSTFRAYMQRARARAVELGVRNRARLAAAAPLAVTV